jgi:hypothetical protein
MRKVDPEVISLDICISIVCLERTRIITTRREF